MAKYFDWDPVKDEKLKKDRGIGFDDVIDAIRIGGLIETRRHPNQKEYRHQQELIVLIGEYVYVVPFVEDEEKMFLKTIFPSRKETKRFKK